MTSDANYTQAFVWVWLPDQTEPVVAGLLSASGKQLVFNYGRSYLARKDAIPLYEPELPLRSGISAAHGGVEYAELYSRCGSRRMGPPHHHQSKIRSARQEC